MIWSVIIYTPALLALAWPFGWLAMVLVAAAFVLGIGVGAAWENEQQDRGATPVQHPLQRWRTWLQSRSGDQSPKVLTRVLPR
jgi:hypothetical protein